MTLYVINLQNNNNYNNIYVLKNSVCSQTFLMSNIE